MSVETTKRKEEESIADIVAEMREFMEACNANDYEAICDEDDFIGFVDRIEAAARRAYNKIDHVVCCFDDVGGTDIGYLRRAMKKTLGDYYE